jgi:drug/metabolite transporter (DMT)-like permease
MMARRAKGSIIVFGVVLTLGASFLAAASDGLTKELGTRASAAQVLCVLGTLVALLSLGANHLGARPLLPGRLSSAVPHLLVARSVLSIVSVALYFQAFQHLALAEVFLFIGLMPVMAAALGAPVLGERVAPTGWVALAIGVVGLSLLLPAGVQSLGLGHLFAFGAALSGTASLVLMRRMARQDHNPLAQVFYPHAALALACVPLLPGQTLTLTPGDLGLILVLSVMMLAVRSMMVIAFTHLRAHLASMLMNLQFVWMLGIGALFFSELPGPAVIFGGGLVIFSGLALSVQEWWIDQRAQAVALAMPGE